MAAGDLLQGAGSAKQVVAATKALLRAFGEAVVLRFITQDNDNGDARQLGLALRMNDEVRIGPAVVQDAKSASSRREMEVLIARDTLSREMESRGVHDAAGLFNVLAGVVIGDRLWRRVGVSAEMMAGVEYMYRVRVTE